MFNPAHAPHITEEEFHSFLYFKNNRHWTGLYRKGRQLTSDMDALRKNLALLLDEQRPVAERLTTATANLKGMGKGIATAILHVAYPNKYGVWNNTSETALKILRIFPAFPRGVSRSFGNRFVEVNNVLLRLSEALGEDLWTLDAMLWRAAVVQDEAKEQEDVEEADGEDEEILEDESGGRFGLERHLHEFLRDNWEHTELAEEWVLYQEDGDPEAGYEYPTGIGRIDLLAKHHNEPRWLVVELKRNQSSDKTVGQVLRYMGWVKQHMAADEEAVEGLVISHRGDEQLEYALAPVPSVRAKRYRVQFYLEQGAYRGALYCARH